MKSTGENENAVEGKKSYHETMEYINGRLKSYDTDHENFIVPWQMVVKRKKEYNF